MTSKLTREWLQHQISEIEVAGITDSNTLAAFKLALAAMDSEPVHQLWSAGIGQWAECDKARYDTHDNLPAQRRILYTAPPLTAMDSEPVAWTDEEELNFVNDMACMWTKGMGINEVPLYRHAQQPVTDNEFIPKNLDKALAVVGVALPESREEFNFQIERWIQRLIDRVIRCADEFKEQPASIVPEILPCSVELKPGLILGKGCKTATLLMALQSRTDHYTEIDAMTPEERAEHDANIEAFKAMLPKPAPVVTDDGREQFEEWFKFHHGDEHSIEKLHRANGGANYGDPHVDLAWIAWKDSRTAMLAAVPPAPVQENI